MGPLTDPDLRRDVRDRDRKTVDYTKTMNVGVESRRDGRQTRYSDEFTEIRFSRVPVGAPLSFVTKGCRCGGRFFITLDPTYVDVLENNLLCGKCTSFSSFCFTVKRLLHKIPDGRQRPFQSLFTVESTSTNPSLAPTPLFTESSLVLSLGTTVVYLRD